MTLTPEQRLVKTEKTLRRAQWLQIWLPFLLGGVFVLVLAAFAVLATRVSVVANCFLIVTLLCPALLCVVPVYFVMIFAVFGMNSAYRTASKPLRSLERLTVRILNWTILQSDRVARQSINLNVRLAPISNWMEHAFDDERKDDD
jgi:hypothetical protein